MYLKNLRKLKSIIACLVLVSLFTPHAAQASNLTDMLFRNWSNFTTALKRTVWRPAAEKFAKQFPTAAQWTKDNPRYALTLGGTALVGSVISFLTLKWYFKKTEKPVEEQPTPPSPKPMQEKTSKDNTDKPATETSTPQQNTETPQETEKVTIVNEESLNAQDTQPEVDSTTTRSKTEKTPEQIAKAAAAAKESAKKITVIFLAKPLNHTTTKNAIKATVQVINQIKAAVEEHNIDVSHSITQCQNACIHHCSKIVDTITEELGCSVDKIQQAHDKFLEEIKELKKNYSDHEGFIKNIATENSKKFKTKIEKLTESLKEINQLKTQLNSANNLDEIKKIKNEAQNNLEKYTNLSAVTKFLNAIEDKKESLAIYESSAANTMQQTIDTLDINDQNYQALVANHIKETSNDPKLSQAKCNEIVTLIEKTVKAKQEEQVQQRAEATQKLFESQQKFNTLKKQKFIDSIKSTTTIDPFEMTAFNFLKINNPVMHDKLTKATGYQAEYHEFLKTYGVNPPQDQKYSHINTKIALGNHFERKSKNGAIIFANLERKKANSNSLYPELQTSLSQKTHNELADLVSFLYSQSFAHRLNCKTNPGLGFMNGTICIDDPENKIANFIRKTCSMPDHETTCSITLSKLEAPVQAIFGRFDTIVINLTSKSVEFTLEVQETSPISPQNLASDLTRGIKKFANRRGLAEAPDSSMNNLIGENFAVRAQFDNLYGEYKKEYLNSMTIENNERYSSTLSFGNPQYPTIAEMYAFACEINNFLAKHQFHEHLTDDHINFVKNLRAQYPDVELRRGEEIILSYEQTLVHAYFANEDNDFLKAFYELFCQLERAINDRSNNNLETIKKLSQVFYDIVPKVIESIIATNAQAQQIKNYLKQTKEALQKTEKIKELNILCPAGREKAGVTTFEKTYDNAKFIALLKNYRKIVKGSESEALSNNELYALIAQTIDLQHRRHAPTLLGVANTAFQTLEPMVKANWKKEDRHKLAYTIAFAQQLHYKCSKQPGLVKALSGDRSKREQEISNIQQQFAQFIAQQNNA